MTKPNNFLLKEILSLKVLFVIMFQCLSFSTFSQLKVCTINKYNIDTSQRRLLVSSISEKESVSSVKERIKADDFQNMMIAERRDSSILWVYFKTDSTLYNANAIEQLYLLHGIESCQDATLYGFQNNQMTDTTVYQDKRLRYHKLLLLKTGNKEP